MSFVEVEDLTKSYGGRDAVRNVTFAIEQGQSVGILGPNGSGKTTTIECLAGLRIRDSGRVRIDGMDPADEPPRLRQELGMQLQECRLPAKITVTEALDLYRSFYPHPRSAAELIERFGLGTQRATRFEQLSGGQQQRLSVALALVGRPRIAFLDELTPGLDPAARREIWSYLAELRTDGLTMLLVTHVMEEAEYLCDRVIVLREGRVAADDTPAGLARRTAAEHTLTFVPSAPVDPAELTALVGVRHAAADGVRIVVTGDADAPGTVLAYLGGRGITAHELRLDTPDLNDAYLALTHSDDTPATAPKGATR
ncbi:MAG: ABC transporter ATP-binding protein [Austwickia sp.]|nr:ABC transporter ATP-binding protein [Austwickia sp.]